ncbi:phosphoribosylamine--glycine ligase [Psychromicrobium xiongbiense]|uniref:phosphoribosylamine--glycine ligase n=1 Tax=Psychromicrobium xiongbiense TaxID=3051184 RepID=UPI002552F4F3|nr:phosphoribosylamine--glycine ligase [Psychromicrobium sp. YIM S02556]
MKVLVVGPGGREHAIVRALLSDPGVREVHAAPGNAGIAALVPTHQVDASDPLAVTALVRTLDPDLVVIGPEAPLVAGVSDAVREAGYPVFGPSQAAATLEGSKAFAKQVMAEAGVPTAMARVASNTEEAAEALDVFGAPYVVKDDGLAAGKGVVVTNDRAEALAHAQSCFDAGGEVVIEEFLDGPEVSLFVLCDGHTVVPLAPAQDFKRIFDLDEGPNTGGMGAYSPLDWVPEGLVEDVVARVAQPTVDEMARRGTPFVGVLYCGLALTSRGLRVIEFNVRFGDPETQAVLARLRSPFGALLLAAAKGKLADADPLRWAPESAVAVVLAAHDYPATPRTGDRIRGIKKANAVPGVHVLHAGTALDEAGKLVSAGGRVLAVVGLGEDLVDARERAYDGLAKIELDGGQYRNDIAAKAARSQVTLPEQRVPRHAAGAVGDQA